MTTGTATATVGTKEQQVRVPVNSQELAKQHASRELIFGIVGHVGSGTSTVAETLEAVLGGTHLDFETYECAIIKARDVIVEWATLHGKIVPVNGTPSIVQVQEYQNLGDSMRSTIDHAAVARGAIKKIRSERAKMQEVLIDKDKPVVPDGSPRAYIIDSIRHPAEVNLLRRVYGDGFVLVGIVCEHSVRKDRISTKYRDAGLDAAEAFMTRDAKADQTFGQRVSDAFHLSDFFIDNTASRFIDDDESQPNPDWDINEDLGRLIRLVTHTKIERPRIDETAMFAAWGAGMRSSCLSRQVGAAILNARGHVVATGTNEVPKAGGGVYGAQFGKETKDDRCFVHKGYCSNTIEQSVIAQAILNDIRADLQSGVDETQVALKLRLGRVGELLEFSRAVHAEMDALLDAARKGVSTIGGRLYVTTFPCHYCARHIVSAGIDEVQFIEPYPKSKAFELHSDSILNDRADSDWMPPSEGGTRVLFRPFTGVAPRMYSRAFRKNQSLKDTNTGQMQISSPEWGSPYDILRTSYAEFEVTLTRDFEG